ncbi:MAG: hypothetical protein AB7S68_25135 [Polyangiaceae bacterium]
MTHAAKVSAPKDYAPVWPYYSFFAVCMGVLHLALAGIGTWMVVMAHEAPRPEVEPVAFGSSVAVLSVLLGIAYCYAPFAPRKPWAWRYHLVLILLGLPSCVLGALPLLVFWLRRDARRMFKA